MWMTNQKIQTTVTNQQSVSPSIIHQGAKTSQDTFDNLPTPEHAQVPESKPSARAYKMNISNHPTTDAAGLDIVLARMQRCFASRAYPQDTEILDVSLRHIFASANTLYSSLLPELTASTILTTTDTQLAQIEQSLHTHYCIWYLLQEIEALLERLEPLCQLLIGAATNILEAFDRSCSIYETSYIKKRLQQEGEDDENTEILAAIEVSHIPENTYYQWMQAVRLLTTRLQNWNTTNKTRTPFVNQFMPMTLAAPSLPHIDTAMDVLFENIHAIFGTMLPEFHTIAKGDDDTTATLLLDIVQKTDQILIQTRTCLEPLHTLIRQYGVESTLQRSQP
jgi:hypothetical protein